MLPTDVSGNLTLVEGRLDVDGLVQTNARWRYVEESRLSSGRFDFYRFSAPIGLTAHSGRAALFRVSLDAGLYQRALDLYVDLRSASGLSLRVGQFVVPTGIEAQTAPRDLQFVEYSLVKGQWKPYDPRDVGLMAMFEGRAVDIAAALVNGNGRNDWLQDENGWKDAAARVVVRPLGGRGSLIAGRSYFGRTGAEGTRFWSSALELAVTHQRLRAATEWQYAIQGSEHTLSFYTCGSFGPVSLLEPTVRVQGVLLRNGDRTVGLTVGLNLLIVEEVKVMLDYEYLARGPKMGPIGSESTVLVQLQAAF